MRSVVGDPAGTFQKRGLERLDFGDTTDPDTFTIEEWHRMNATAPASARTGPHRAA